MKENILLDKNGNVVPNEERQRVECYSRVVGYLRPINQWNEGKRAEFDIRHLYDKDVDKKYPNEGGESSEQNSQPRKMDKEATHQA